MKFDEAGLIETYRPRVLYFLLRKLRNRSLAEDLAQETLLAAIEALRENRLQEEDKLPAFIFGIAKNLLCKASRREIQQCGMLAQPDRGDPVAWSADPEAEILLKEQRESVRRALGGLSEADADILRRFFAEAGSIEKIAKNMGIGYAAARKRKSRALKRLRVLFLEMSQKGRS